jgi:hypothetical protein
MAETDALRQWSPATRVAFRLTFVYLALYTFAFVANAIPDLFHRYTDFWDVIVLEVGARVFGVAITARPSQGSGDTTWSYVQVFCFLVLAVAATVAWTLLDRRRPAYPRLFRGLRFWVRYYLAAIMLLYAAVKVIPTQFSPPTLDRLVQPFGDASPMGLMWTFMGASAGYSVFAGCGELLGGLLLTTRRTTLLGALVCAGVLANVVALNLCYDVPVKLGSSHLLVMALFLIAPDLRRLADLFLLGRAGGPFENTPFLPGWTWTRRAVVAVRTVLVAAFVGLALSETYDRRQQAADPANRSPLYGIWEVESFEADGQGQNRGADDPTRWRRVIFDDPETLAVQRVNDRRDRYGLKLDPAGKTLALTNPDGKGSSAALTYAEPEAGVLTLTGTFDGRAVRARLRRVAAPSFRLLNRGFHWVNEDHFNR